MDKSYIKLLKIFGLICTFVLLSACSLLSAGNDQEIEALEKQIDQMATQNALLQAQIESSSNDGVEVPQPPQEDSQPQTFQVTPTPESLPGHPIPAGEPIIFEGWSLTASTEIKLSHNGDDFGFILYLRNLEDKDRLFRFTNAGIRVRDNFGNYYDFSRDMRCEEGLHEVKNATIRANDVEEFSSLSPVGYNWCNSLDDIDSYQGPIPLNVDYFILEINDFGPFDGVEITIDL